MRISRFAAIVVVAAVTALPAYGQQQPQVVYLHQQPQIVYLSPNPVPQGAVVYVPVPSSAASHPSAAIKYEPVDEAQRAREHARYEAEKRRGAIASPPAYSPEQLRARLAAQQQPTTGQQIQTSEERQFADEARARVLERTPALNSHERSVTMSASDPRVEREDPSPASYDSARAREILSNFR